MVKVRILNLNRLFDLRKIDDLLFPFSTKEVIYFLTIWCFLDLANLNPLQQCLPSFIVDNHYLYLISGLILALFLILVARVTLTLLLYYHGWLFEEIGKVPSLPTRLFMVLLTRELQRSLTLWSSLVSGVSKRASFFTWQQLLPWQMPPRVRDTVVKYLRSMEPILETKEMEKLKGQASEFEKNVGWKLQRKLWLKWFVSKNYLSDWWKELIYMRYRDSLIRSNVGCADVIYQKTTKIQAARAAYVILNRQHFCREIFDENRMKPVTLGSVPMCAEQYRQYHRTLRVPGAETDRTIYLGDTARHIALYHKGCWYKIDIIDRNSHRLIRPAELEKSIQSLLDTPGKPARGEKLLSALTCGPRQHWAEIRAKKFAGGINKQSLDIIETALEIVFLDEEERFYDETDSSQYNREYARALHGDGYMLWCDKPSVYIFSKNGRFSSNAEHSPCDAMIYVQVREYIKYHEQFGNPYNSNGHCTGKCERIPKVERLKWNMDEETSNAIEKAYQISKSIADDFENDSIVYTEYGKEFMKKAKVSPDAFIQMALQMAYFKDQQKFEQTYEPAVMRLFKNGRTETVRSCSIESCQFVRSILSSNDSAYQKLEKLKKACESHQNYYREAMSGTGVDRHLFALYVISKHLQIPSDFLSNVFSRNWALSTSQTPQHQMIEYAKQLNKEPSLFWPAGGFSCPDGSNYGVCYTIATTGDRISFHVTSWKSLKHTNSQRFLRFLVESLQEMRTVIEEATADN